MQLPLFVPQSEWRPPNLADLPSWAEAKRICVDVETYDPHLKQLGIGVRRGGHVVGVSFKIEDGPGAYLPMRHKGGDNLPEDQVLRYLRANAKAFKGQVVGANLSYDLDYLWEEEVLFPEVQFYRDIQIADPLIYELHDSYSLDSIAKRHGLPGKNEEKLREAAAAYGVSPKHGMHQLPARFVGAYAEADTEQPLLTLRRQERLIDENDLWNVWNLESKVLPALVRMRRRGVRVDMERLRKIEAWSLDEEAKALEKVRHATGIRIAVGDVWKAGALAPALTAVGIKLTETSNGKPSIDKDVLGSIDHPVPKALSWARKVNKVRTTFAQSVRTYLCNGRIHTTFNQIAREDEAGDQRGARYGRLSSTHPNLQQQPARDEFAKEWRSIYIPEDGALWCANDYSQQEPRWTTHFAAIYPAIGKFASQHIRDVAAAAAKAYRDDPKLDNHDFFTRLVHGDEACNAMSKDEWKKQRSRCKNIYLGICYGEGGAKLCHDLKLPTRWALGIGRGKDFRIEYFPTQEQAWDARRQLEDGRVWQAAGEEGQAILDKVDQRAPYLRALAKEAEERAKKAGCITTISGRKLHFPQRTDGAYDWAHKALNRLIQGTSADQVKMALVELDAQGYFLQLQVHDEIDSSVGDEGEGARIAQVMRDICPAQVPFRVDTEFGPSWGESMG